MFAGGQGRNCGCSDDVDTGTTKMSRKTLWNYVCLSGPALAIARDRQGLAELIGDLLTPAPPLIVLSAAAGSLSPWRRADFLLAVG